MVTCGDDKLIKVWDMIGRKLYNSEGHETPIYSVCPHHKENTQVKIKLRGHQKRITGLAFSSNLNIMLSSGADGQLFIWNTDPWEKKKSVTVQHPAGKMPVVDTRVQFHSDQWVPQDVLPAAITYAATSY
ncbi:protein TPR1-like [Papaver somniferum]|uniref:protein TPR1-like n=1 Tax=Papaver somniferum TaxID=3469 RepID=UPI000E6F983E|nr:protein TPR1-like [Papaver somniferum]